MIDPKDEKVGVVLSGMKLLDHATYSGTILSDDDEAILRNISVPRELYDEFYMG